MNKKLKRVTYSALFVCGGILFPFLTASNPELGNMFCLMHIPVLLCGFICGFQWGAVVGFVTPLIRSVIVGTPMIFPGAVAMAFELAAFGLITGLLYRLLPKKGYFVYIELVFAMIIGRFVWGGAMLVINGISGSAMTFYAFATTVFVTAIPGMIIQLAVIPPLVILLEKTENLLN